MGVSLTVYCAFQQEVSETVETASPSLHSSPPPNSSPACMFDVCVIPSA